MGKEFVLRGLLVCRQSGIKTDGKSADEDEQGAEGAVWDLVLVGRNQLIPGEMWCPQQNGKR